MCEDRSQTPIRSPGDPSTDTWRPTVTPASPPTLMTLGSILDEFETEASRAHDAHRNGRPGGPVTSFRIFDTALGGSIQQGIHVYHGGPGTGKTALVLQIAATCGTPALFVSCEMSPLELLRRITARVTGTFLSRIRSGELPPADAVALARRAVDACPSLAVIDATGGNSPSVEHLHEAVASVRAMANRAVGAERQALAEGAVLVIDSGHAWAAGLGGASMPEYDRLNEAIGGLHALSGASRIAILVTAERNRASMRSDGMSATAGTRTWEYRAETVVAMDDDESGSSAGTGVKVIKLKMSKNRNGSAADFRLGFRPATMTFKEVA